MCKRTGAAALWAAAFLAAVPAGSGTAAQAAEAPPGALSCSGCHPPNTSVDTPVSPLVGFYGSSIAMAMKAFRGRRPATVMGRIARGFSDEEIKAIEAWYVAQPAVTDAGSPPHRP